MADLDRRIGRKLDCGHSAPSWQDYIDALKVEGRRYRPASLGKALEERDAAGGNLRHSAKNKTMDGSDR